ncbi:uncharacterized protein LOC116656022 [Drosophila ananassae]|uniref:uncharacterized protein LOC116656022 n=1 Tax=Drosophila ananassae TaxID=7217 RepID=UPI0013A5DA48|nr:uncharacterized protein LOC116656022 [Drosophila ananassae]
MFKNYGQVTNVRVAPKRRVIVNRRRPVVAEPEPVLAAPELVLAAPDPVLAAPELVLAAPELVLAAPDPVLAAPELVLAAPELVLAAPDPVLAAPEPVEDGAQKNPKRLYRTRYEHKWKEVVHFDGNGTKWVNEKLQCPLCFLPCASNRKYSAHFAMCAKIPKVYGCQYCPFIKALPNLGQHRKFRCKGNNTLYEAVGEMADLRQRWRIQKNEERAVEDTAEELYGASEEILDGIFD